MFDGPVGACVPFPNAPETLAYSINNQSQIVGNYVTFVCDPQGSHTVDHGFLWVKGTLTTIDVPHSTNTDLYGINDHGEMVGSYTDASGTPHGFLLSKGTFTDIVVPHSPDVPIPFGINNQGDIVGNLGLHGFLLSKGRFTLIDPPGSVQTDARKISDQGEIVGFYMDANFLFHGYLFSPGRDETDARGDNEQGAFTEITVPGGANVEVFGINDRHEVVGDYADASNPSEALHSFEMQVGTETEAP